MPECSFLCEEARAYLAPDAPLPHGIGILAGREILPKAELRLFSSWIYVVAIERR
jgi:hypothetical protein